MPEEVSRSKCSFCSSTWVCDQSPDTVCYRCGARLIQWSTGRWEWLKGAAARAINDSVEMAERRMQGHFESIHRELRLIRQRQLRRPKVKEFQYFPSAFRN